MHFNLLHPADRLEAAESSAAAIIASRGISLDVQIFDQMVMTINQACQLKDLKVFRC